MKTSKLSYSELILNPDGSIYHLNLLPEQLADTVITVGDQDRVAEVSKYFDSIEVKVQKREFKTHTGNLNGKRISVISTGIGTDNIDIVLNEVDALKNIDMYSRKVKDELTSLEIYRIGTSGSIQPDLDVDSFVASEKAIGFDGLIYFYGDGDFNELDYADSFSRHINWNSNKAKPYVISANKELLDKFSQEEFIRGTTATNIGFYGPQGRILRLGLEDKDLNKKLQNFRFKGNKITNMEMETSGIYALSQMLGHKAVSLNAIVANRSRGTFSANLERTIDRLIKSVLRIITT